MEFSPQRLSYTKLSVYEEIVEFQINVFLVYLSYVLSLLTLFFCLVIRHITIVDL